LHWSAELMSAFGGLSRRAIFVQAVNNLQAVEP
jgi:hypothetical protein